MAFIVSIYGIWICHAVLQKMFPQWNGACWPNQKLFTLLTWSSDRGINEFVKLESLPISFDFSFSVYKECVSHQFWKFNKNCGWYFLCFCHVMHRYEDMKGMEALLLFWNDRSSYPVTVFEFFSSTLLKNLKEIE